MMQLTDRFSQVGKAIRAASEERDASAALNILVHTAYEATRASTARLYKLNLASGEFVVDQHCEINRDDRPAEISADVMDLGPTKCGSLLELVVSTKEPKNVGDVSKTPLSRWHTRNTRSRLVVPVVRGQACLGTIDLESTDSHAFDDQDLGTVESLAAALQLVMERQYMLSLLSTLQRPLDFNKPFEEYIKEVTNLLVEATQMPILSLRELVGEELRCLQIYGLDQQTTDLLMEPFERYGPFKEAVEHRTTSVIVDKEVEDDTPVRSLPQWGGVRSYLVTPIEVGTGVFGTLSAATGFKYDFPDFMVQGLKMAANATGVAILNHRNFISAEEGSFKIGAIGATLMGSRFLAMARHRALTKIDEFNNNLGSIILTAENNALPDISHLARPVSRGFKSLTALLEDSRLVSRIPDVAPSQQKIRSVWRSAFGSIQSTLDDRNITYAIHGDDDIWVTGQIQYLQMTFVLLIENSIAAFERIEGNRPRVITVNITTPDSPLVTCRYEDTAGGIDPTSLKIPDDPKIPEVLEQALFHAGVTGKRQGTGLGLWIVKTTIEEQKGTIELIEFKNESGGVTFEMSLPSDQWSG